MCETLEVQAAVTLERIDAAVQAVWDADSAWAADLGNDELRQTYRDAKAAYKALADQAEDEGLLVECGRCGGAGGWVGWPGWTCFRCGGSGKAPFKRGRFQAMPPTRAKKAAKAAALREAERAQADENYASFAEKHPAQAALLDTYRTHDELDPDDEDGVGFDHFFSGLKERVRRYGELSDAQIACIDREIAKRADEAAATPFPSGTHTVSGVVVGTKDTRGYGGGTKWNMIVKLGGEHRGNTIMGTIPARLLDALEDHATQTAKSVVGAKVEFAAQIEQGREPHFGFFKSPKAVKLIGHTLDDGRGR